jgi:hypothetical protein
MTLLLPEDRPDQEAGILVAGSLFAFAENSVRAGLVEAWFFIRYSDPDPHLSGGRQRVSAYPYSPATS